MKEFGFKLTKNEDETCDMEFVSSDDNGIGYREGTNKNVTREVLEEILSSYEQSGYKITYCRL